MTDAILVLNAGSSSLKFQVFDRAGDDLTIRLRGQVEGIGSRPSFRATAADGTALDPLDGLDTGHTGLLDRLRTWIADHLGGDPLVAAGHRVVHGGDRFGGSVLVDDAVLADLDALTPLAPLHQPHNLGPIRALAAALPDLPQVACFDTAFHRTQPALHRRFALPRDLHDQGIKRYGFHGLSYAYVTADLRHRVPEIAGGKVIIAHLGSGASLCAVEHGRSVESSMGFTALDGVIMGTRPGSLDAGVVLHLMRQGWSADRIETLLYKQSGLLGVSGISNDMRDLLESERDEAAEAVALFVHRIGREIGALAATLGGLDAVVFTAGIGERSAEIRARVCRQAGWLGVRLDPEANQRCRGEAGRISAPDSRVPVWTIPTNEELMIARDVVGCLTGA
jgi:acetate kinase